VAKFEANFPKNFPKNRTKIAQKSSKNCKKIAQKWPKNAKTSQRSTKSSNFPNRVASLPVEKRLHFFAGGATDCLRPETVCGRPVGVISHSRPLVAGKGALTSFSPSAKANLL